MRCAVRWSGSGRTDMARRLGIVCAMKEELAPLLRRARRTSIDGVQLYELPGATIAVSGIGREAGLRAAETLVNNAKAELLVSAGFAGALTPHIQVGTVGWARQMIEASSGTRYAVGDGTSGTWRIATADMVSGPAEKRELAASFAADAVDMEGAHVAAVAKKYGLEFRAVKVISDDLDHPLPPMSPFVDEQGKLHQGRFAAYVALRPRWWWPVIKLGLNSRKAAAHLSEAVKHLIQQDQIAPQERISLG